MADQASGEAKKSGGGAPTWLVIVTAVLSACSALAVAYIGLASKNIEVDAKRDEIAAEQARFDADERRQTDESLKAIVPMILSSTDAERQVGLALLRILHRGREAEVLTAIQSLPVERSSQNAEAAITLDRAVRLLRAEPTERWVILVGADKALDAAKTEVEKAKANGLSAQVYQKEGWFRTAIGPFPTRPDADRAAIAVRASIAADAYVNRLNSWCAQPQARDGYTECR